MKPARPAQHTGPALASVGRVRTQVRVSDRVYDELASAIRELRIPPGSSLSETDLSERLHVSRTPLREAITRLVETGLVSVIPQVGTRVEPIRRYDVEQACFVRGSLESSAVLLACAKPERDVRRLRALLAEQRRCLREQDLDGFFAADESLHEQIFTLSGFPGAWQVIQPIKMHLDRIRRLSLPNQKTMRALIGEHTAIVDAVADGAAETAQDLVAKHSRRATMEVPMLQTRYPDYFAE